MVQYNVWFQNFKNFYKISLDISILECKNRKSAIDKIRFGYRLDTQRYNAHLICLSPCSHFILYIDIRVDILNNGQMDIMGMSR